MELAVACDALDGLIQPHNLKTSKKGGRRPNLLTSMLRIHLLQQGTRSVIRSWKRP